MRSRSGFATHAVVILLTIAAGAGGAWLVKVRSGIRPPAPEGEWIQIPAQPNPIRAYVAHPGRRDAAPAMIVIHEIFGLTEWEPTVADQMAANGYVAIVPDLLSSRWGMSPPGADSGRKLIALLTPDGITADLEATYAWLNRQNTVRKDQIGVIGFCWGGGQSFRYATNNPRLKAAVVCYGPAPDSAAIPRINAAVLGVYGEADARINGALPDVARQMQSAGKRFAYDSYPGTGHGFLKPGRRGADTGQPAKAWERIFTFLGQELKP